MSEESNQIGRLLDKLELMGNSLARIEEQIKPIADIKKDVDTLKVATAEIMSMAKSAHKRLDGHDKDMKELDDSMKELPTQKDIDEHEKRISRLEKCVIWVSGLIIAAVIAAVMSLVLIQN